MQNDQLWVRGLVWNPKRLLQRVPVDILCDTGAGGGSYVSLTLWSALRKHAGLRAKVSRQGRGYLHAANPLNSGVTPMRIPGTPTIPVVFTPEDYVRPVPVCIVHAVPYGLILGA